MKMNVVFNKAKVGFVRYSSEFSAICSVNNKPIWGSITFEYEPEEVLLELMSIDGWSRQLADKKLLAEDVARLAFDEARRVLGDIFLRVHVYVETTVHAPVEAIIEGGGSNE